MLLLPGLTPDSVFMILMNIFVIFKSEIINLVTNILFQLIFSDRFLEKVSEAKEKYLKKMDILNNMVL